MSKTIITRDDIVGYHGDIPTGKNRTISIVTEIARSRGLNAEGPLRIALDISTFEYTVIDQHESMRRNLDKGSTTGQPVRVSDIIEAVESMRSVSPVRKSDDDLIDELWGRLCPDMGQQDFRDAVKAVSTIPEIRDIPEEDRCEAHKEQFTGGTLPDRARCILRKGHGGQHKADKADIGLDAFGDPVPMS